MIRTYLQIYLQGWREKNYGIGQTKKIWQSILVLTKEV